MKKNNKKTPARFFLQGLSSLLSPCCSPNSLPGKHCCNQAIPQRHAKDTQEESVYFSQKQSQQFSDFHYAQPPSEPSLPVLVTSHRLSHFGRSVALFHSDLWERKKKQPSKCQTSWYVFKRPSSQYQFRICKITRALTPQSMPFKVRNITKSLRTSCLSSFSFSDPNGSCSNSLRKPAFDVHMEEIFLAKDLRCSCCFFTSSLSPLLIWNLIFSVSDSTRYNTLFPFPPTPIFFFF